MPILDLTKSIGIMKSPLRTLCENGLLDRLFSNFFHEQIITLLFQKLEHKLVVRLCFRGKTCGKLGFTLRTKVVPVSFSGHLTVTQICRFF